MSCDSKFNKKLQRVLELSDKMLQAGKVKKAYSWNSSDFDIELIEDTLTLSYNAGEAKSYFASVCNVPFIKVRVKREPWADKYNNVSEIPFRAWIFNGFYLNCPICNNRIESTNNLVTFNDEKYCCLSCFRKGVIKNV